MDGQNARKSSLKKGISRAQSTQGVWRTSTVSLVGISPRSRDDHRSGLWSDLPMRNLGEGKGRDSGLVSGQHQRESQWRLSEETPATTFNLNEGAENLWMLGVCINLSNLCRWLFLFINTTTCDTL